jgi:hypothetical protein
MQLNPYARHVELCERLVGATMLGEVEWTVEEETAFVCRRSSGTVGIRSRDRDGEPPYELVIFNSNGAKVETLLSEWSAEEEPALWNRALADLYRTARRNALGVDKLLDDLLAELPATQPAQEPARL